MRQSNGKTSRPAVDKAGYAERNQAAQGALAEAGERRRLQQLNESAQPKEIYGRGGLDPARYGDWEVKGIVSDF